MSAFSSESYADFKKSWQSPAEEVAAPSVSRPLADPSVGVFLPWLMCLVLGYLASNIVLINDIYCGGISVKGRLMPSPIAAWELSRVQLAGMYSIATCLTVAGAVVVTRRQIPQAYGMSILVPIVTIPYVAGLILRKSGAAARYLACGYLLAGTILTGLAVMYFATTSAPLTEFQEEPMINSFMLQGGLTLAICAILILRKDDEMPRPTAV